MSRHGAASWVLFLTFFRLGAFGAQNPVNIRVLEGDRAINSIKLHRGHDIVVQVVDDRGEPIAAASVTFILPASGPSAFFANNSATLTVQTDWHGIAAARGLKPNRVEGPFHIHVTTSWHAEPASATIVQTNAEAVAKASSSKWVVVALVAGGAAAGGVAAAAHGGKSAAGTPNASLGATSSSTITAGSPTFGPPH